MKKLLLASCILFFSVKTYGQQFSQYNTGTLYDSFENPAQAAFIPDSSKYVAFNLFIPNFNSNAYLTGNAQATVKNRLINGTYVKNNLIIGNNRFSRANASANIYTLMFKVFTSLNGNQEVGFSIQSRAEGKGLFSDESFMLLNGPSSFPKDDYSNILNDSYTVQTYHQFSLSYREKVNKNFAFGVKLSGLLGIQYQKLQIDQSHVTFDKINNSADITLQGNYRINYTSGPFSAQDIQPSFKNPGAAISIGTALRTRDGFNIQGNVKDLGFIHWSNRSTISNFNTTLTAPEINGPRREDNLYATVHNIIRSGDKRSGFITPTNGKAELSANKSYWFDYDKKFKYSPTVIVQKEIFDNGYTAAMVNPFQYNNLTGTVTASYNNYGIFTTGLQFMVKTPNVEFYMGTDRLLQSVSSIGTVAKSTSQLNKNSSFTGADIFLGFSIKMGHRIEHPMNTTRIPLGDRPGFVTRLWNSIFHPSRDIGD